MRYNRPEPIGQAGSLNLYMYADGDPINRIDRTGLADQESLTEEALTNEMSPEAREAYDKTKISPEGAAAAASLIPGVGDLMDAAETGYSCGSAAVGTGSAAECGENVGFMLTPVASVRAKNVAKKVVKGVEEAVDIGKDARRTVKGAIVDKGEQIVKNKSQGAAFENTVKSFISETDTNVVEQLMVKTKTGTKTRIDFASTGESGNIKLTEAKSSPTAPKTKKSSQGIPRD